jgi:phage repressor protein C with HTH and peptisase S24 domain
VTICLLENFVLPVTDLAFLYFDYLLLFVQARSKKNLNLSKAETLPKIISLNSEKNENIMMVNQRAAAGYPQNVHEREWYKQLPAFDMPLPEFRNATHRGFQIEGDSMMPNLKPDEWVLAKAVPDLNLTSNNKIHVVITYDTVVVKKLHKLDDPSKIRLISLNRDYVPFEIKVSEIQELWEVTSKLTFSLDANSENHLLKELQDSMEDLKTQLKDVKKA